jgi:hypothetical protein
MIEQEFDRIIKEKLEGINSAPPADMWGRIAANIPATAPAATVAASTAMSSAIKAIIVAASILIVGGLSYLVSHKNTQTERSHIENTNYSNQDYVIKHVDVKYDVVAEENQELNESSENKTTNLKSIIASKKADKSINKDKETVAFNKQFDSLERTQKANNKKASHNKANASVTPTPEVKKEEMSFVENTEVNDLEQELTQELSNEEKVMVETTTIMPNNLIVVNEQNKEEEQAVVAVAENKSSKAELVEKKGQMSETTAEAINNPKNRKINKYSIGLHYGPEFMDIDGLKLTDQAVDFSFNYQNYNFILQTGIGVRMSSDRVAYDMKYKRWDYLETQIRFDSAVFVIDQNGNAVLKPVDPYYVEVYDSLNHSYSATAIEQNVMLQVPLLIGYQVDFKKFAYFVKGGIRYSLVVYKNTKNLMEVDEHSHLVNMNYTGESRAKSNIDYELAFGGSYKLTKQLCVEAEVFGRYYHYSIYEENPPSGIHPWSLSGRVGLVYSLK